MKKIVLMMLVAMVPFLTMAQKRSKKGKNTKIEKVAESNASYEFMVIIGYEMMDKGPKHSGEAINSAELQMKKMMKSTGKTIINFDFGGIKNKSASNLMQAARGYRTMAAAVNGAANSGWEFVNSDVILSGTTKVHYYYMRKNK